MALISDTGSVQETSKEMSMQWSIPGFRYQAGEADTYSQSPVFFLCGLFWRLRIYPNGTQKSPGWVGLFLWREDSGPPKSVIVSATIERKDGYAQGYKNTSVPYIYIEYGIGWEKFISFDTLRSQKSMWLPLDILTVTVSLTRVSPCPIEVSLPTRLWNLSRDLKRMLDEGKGTDFALKVKEGRELRAHRKILDARCGYFSGMLANDFQENASGVADIDDIEEGVLQCILNYLYTGEAVGMADRNVCNIYVAADKLLLEELKKLCVDYIKGNLSVVLICDAIAVLENYDETNLKACTLDYFTKHVKEIFDSDGWKKFSKEKSPLVASFFEKFAVWRRP